jgi:pseudouridine-5'-phosphate glycosidase/pseudouridine kinase
MLSAFTQPVPPSLKIGSVIQRTDNVEHEHSAPVSGLGSDVSPDIVVAGALACDYSCDFVPLDETAKTPQPHTSNPAIIRQSLGGVAHNVAKAAHYLGGNVKLISLVGNDLDGNSTRAQLNSEGMRTDGVEVCAHEDARTSRYVAVNDTKKDLVVAMADMKLLNTHGPFYMQTQWKKELQAHPPKWFVADANWEPYLLLDWFQTATAAGCYTAFEPVSVAKGSRLFKPATALSNTDVLEVKQLGVFNQNVIDLMAPNAMELAAIHSTARDSGLLEDDVWWTVIDKMGIPSTGIRSRLVDVSSIEIVDKGIPQQAIQLLPFVPCIVTKLGLKGVLLTMLLSGDDPRLSSPEAAPYIISRNRNTASGDRDVRGVYMRLYPPVAKLDECKIVSVNGVGDTFLGALIATLNATGRGVEELIDFAQNAAVMTLQYPGAVNPGLRGHTVEALYENGKPKKPFYQLTRQ